jgi:hypothetical protein
MAQQSGLMLQPCSDGPIAGVGGLNPVIGKVSAPVKVGRSYSDVDFLVLSQSISGFSVLLGQDYMQQVGCAIRVTRTMCCLEIDSYDVLLRNWRGSC